MRQEIEQILVRPNIEIVSVLTINEGIAATLKHRSDNLSHKSRRYTNVRGKTFLKRGTTCWVCGEEAVNRVLPKQHSMILDHDILRESISLQYPHDAFVNWPSRVRSERAESWFKGFEAAIETNPWFVKELLNRVGCDL
jgi:hypothetical protein